MRLPRFDVRLVPGWKAVSRRDNLRRQIKLVSTSGSFLINVRSAYRKDRVGVLTFAIGLAAVRMFGGFEIAPTTVPVNLPAAASDNVLLVSPAGPVNLPTAKAFCTLETFISDPPGTKPIFFETIDERNNQAGIPKLRQARIANEDIEIRVWSGFGKTAPEGFVLKRVNGRWSAMYLYYDLVSGGPRTLWLAEPASGWDASWSSLLQHRILTLPDAESINCNGRAFDGVSYVVEAKKGKDYRTYMYENPEMREGGPCPQTSDLFNILKIITREYDAA